MRIAIASDHRGFEAKRKLIPMLKQRGHQVEDFGCDTPASCDYPDFAHDVARRVVDGQAERGVLVCGTGQGMAMTVNKVPGVRAAVVADTFSARMASLHNDARVLCLGERVVGPGLALACVDAWLGAAFEGGRHQRRVDKIEGR